MKTKEETIDVLMIADFAAESCYRQGHDHVNNVFDQYEYLKKFIKKIPKTKAKELGLI